MAPSLACYVALEHAYRSWHWQHSNLHFLANPCSVSFLALLPSTPMQLQVSNVHSAHRRPLSCKVVCALPEVKLQWRCQLEFQVSNVHISLLEGVVSHLLASFLLQCFIVSSPIIDKGNCFKVLPIHAINFMRFIHTHSFMHSLNHLHEFGYN